ncbi:MAG: hypothetical protein IH808_11930 [Proteobacteria bacterium]|nr:hypothetical protein [Pseudomonadota bacterium]
MTQENPAHDTKRTGAGKRKTAYWRTFIIVGATALLLAVFVWTLPRGYSVDLSLIGKGSNVAVLVHDQGMMGSEQLMRVVSNLRSQYEPQTMFIVADVNTPTGRAFANAHGTQSGTLILFGPRGDKLATFYGPQDEAKLRDSFDQLFRR